MRRIRSFLAIAAVAALAVAAIGSTASARPAADGNIVQTAVAAGQFTTLATLLQQTGLADTLAGGGPFTVFAPTDAAFAKVPPATPRPSRRIRPSCARSSSTTSSPARCRRPTWSSSPVRRPSTAPA